MKLDTDALEHLASVAVSAANEAGHMIAASRPQEIDHKTSAGSLASQVVTEIDRASEAAILEHLAPTLGQYELGMLTEERDDNRGRLRHDHFWCIDPLDGTLPFIEGRPGSAVSIALVARNGSPLLGVIYDVTGGRVVQAIAGAGVLVDGNAWPVVRQPHGETLTVFADRSLLAGTDADAIVNGLESVARGLGLERAQVEVGAGAVMNAMGALATPPGCYLKLPTASGGGSLWDFAATACVFRELGASATDIHGRPLDLNRADSTFMHHRGVLFATDAELADRLRSLVSSRG